MVTSLRRLAVLITFLGAVSTASADDFVRYHVRVAPSFARGTDALSRQSAASIRLSDQVRAFDGEVRAFVDPSPALRRALDSRSPRVREALDRLARWFVLDLPVDMAPSWRASVAVGREFEVVEIPNTIDVARAIDVDDPDVPARLAWMFELIDLAPAWDDVRAEQGDVVAAVVDVGFDVDHPELAPNLWVNPGEVPGNDIDDDGNGYVDDVHGFNMTLADGDVLYLEEYRVPPPGTNIEDSRRHGTSVAGVIGAMANNGTAGAGVAYNPKLMLVSVQDDDGVGLDTTYAYGGITYAALNGAAVINCSWRGVWFPRPNDTYQDSARFRQFENDVVEAATALGSLVVAAAGNDDRADLVTSPGHYPSVMAVAATNDATNPWQLWQNSNAGPWIDIAAPGDGVHVIIPDGRTTRWSGTSFAAPIVSAAAVLLKTKWPEWTPEQIRARLRATARSIDATEVDPAKVGGAGRGMVQIGAAVTAPMIPALSIRDVRFIADDQSEVFAPGDDVAVAFEASSLFAYDGPVEIRLETDDPYIVPFEDSLYLPQVAQGALLSVRRGLELKLRETAPYGHVARIDLVVEAGREVDRQSFYVDAMPYQYDVRSSALELSVVPTGKLGYAEYNRPLASSGVGFRRIGEAESSLFTGSFLMGTGPNQVVDAVQAYLPSSPIEGFRPLEDQAVQSVEIVTDEDGWTRTTLRMITSSRGDGLSVRVDHEILTHEAPGRGEFVLSRWTLRPISLGSDRRADAPAVWENVHTGILMDWTAGDGGEVVHTDASTGTQWAGPRDGTSNGRYVGARVLDSERPIRADHFAAVGPNEEDDGAGEVYMIDREDLRWAMTEEMLWSVLSPDATRAEAREGNVVGTLGTGPHPPVAIGDELEFVVALSIASTREELFEALDDARVAWSSLLEGGDGTPAPRLELLPNVPNPFNPRTSIRFALSRPERVTVELFDVRGRRIQRLVDETRDAGYHRVEWDGRDEAGREVASGVYYVRVRTAEASSTGRMVLVR